MAAEPGDAASLALITGAGGGIGRATALALAGSGVDVALVDLSPERAESVARECGAFGVTAAAWGLDQCDPDAAYGLPALVQAAFGSVPTKVLLNAGIGTFAPFLDMAPELWRRTIDVNLTGTFYLAQAFAKAMIAGGHRGSIVLTASSGATTVCDQLSAYCASKAAVLMLARHMATELGPARIRTNAVLPGVIATDMTAPMLERTRWQNMIARETPVGRAGRPEEVARLVAFLLSEDAGYINGEGIAIDGGSTLHGYPRWFAQDYSTDDVNDWKSRFAEYPYAPATAEHQLSSHGGADHG
jgi:NAD(P)-dependent dehydrogenase (short-subunit alcohol dehydrogenase family)